MPTYVLLLFMFFIGVSVGVLIMAVHHAHTLQRITRDFEQQLERLVLRGHRVAPPAELRPGQQDTNDEIRPAA